RRPRGRLVSPGTDAARCGRALDHRRSAAGCSRVAADRQVRRHTEAAPVSLPGIELSPEQRYPFAHADEALPRASRSDCGSAVVHDLELEPGGAKRDRDRDMRRVRVLERVRQSLLLDAVDGELDAAGQRARFANDLEAYGQSGLAVAGDEVFQLGKRRLW